MELILEYGEFLHFGVYYDYGIYNILPNVNLDSEKFNSYSRVYGFSVGLRIKTEETK